MAPHVSVYIRVAYVLSDILCKLYTMYVLLYGYIKWQVLWFIGPVFRIVGVIHCQLKGNEWCIYIPLHTMSYMAALLFTFTMVYACICVIVVFVYLHRLFNITGHLDASHLESTFDVVTFL